MLFLYTTEKETNMNKNLRKLNCKVSSQTLYHLEHFAATMGVNNVGIVIDKLMREKMLSMRVDQEEKAG